MDLACREKERLAQTVKVHIPNMAILVVEELEAQTQGILSEPIQDGLSSLDDAFIPMHR